MQVWEKIKGEFVDIIEWNDDTSDTLVWRFPRYSSQIKYGAQLTVRPAQAAVFVNEGRIADVYRPGMHTLETRNMPVLSTLQGWKYGFNSPFKADVFFVSTRQFTDLKWGTRNPIMLRDAEFGAVRLKAFGTYVIRVKEPAVFVKEIAGTNPHFAVDGVSEQLRNLIITRFSDHLASCGIPVLDLAANYNELSALLAKRMAPEFVEYGLELATFLVENISLPEEVEKALDKRTSMGVVGNLDSFVKYQTGVAMETGAANPGGEASAGVGMGIGFAMANQMGQAVAGAGRANPPPLPGAVGNWHVGVKGNASGPHDMSALSALARDGALTRDTLVWREGMSDWIPAGTVAELKLLFSAVPPPFPGKPT